MLDNRFTRTLPRYLSLACLRAVLPHRDKRSHMLGAVGVRSDGTVVSARNGNVPAMGAKPGAALNGFLGAPAQGSGHAETGASPTAPASAPAPAAPVLVALEGGAAQVAAPVEGGAGAVAGVAEAMSASRRALRQRWASCATGWLRARGGRSAGAGQ